MCRIVQIGLLNIDVHWWQNWRTLVRVTTHTRNVIYAETCPINYTVAMGLLHGEIAAAWCVCVGHPDSAEMFRDMHPWPRTVFMIIWLITTSIASTQTSGHKPRKSEFRKLGMEREPSRGYTRNTIHAWEVFWGEGITMPDSHTVKFIFLLVKFNVMNIVKLSSGKGQARIGKGWPLRRKASKLEPLG